MCRGFSFVILLGCMVVAEYLDTSELMLIVTKTTVWGFRNWINVSCANIKAS
ncbi:hypothetical protein M758_1G149900 [Ceratodon purpureus]|nr:hypothetical protein M758_1G149900 [Ceratodon purpureus]